MIDVITPGSWWFWLAVVVVFVTNKLGVPFWPAMGWTAGIVLLLAFGLPVLDRWLSDRRATEAARQLDVIFERMKNEQQSKQDGDT